MECDHGKLEASGNGWRCAKCLKWYVTASEFSKEKESVDAARDGTNPSAGLHPTSSDVERKTCGAGAAALPALEAWRPIASAPKDRRTPILLASAAKDDLDETPEIVTLGWWEDAEADGCDYMGHDGGFMDYECSDFIPGRSIGNPTSHYPGRQPTHWRPLPFAPKPETVSDERDGAVAERSAARSEHDLALSLADTIISRLPANGEHWSLILRYNAARSEQEK